MRGGGTQKKNRHRRYTLSTKIVPINEVKLIRSLAGSV